MTSDCLMVAMTGLMAEGLSWLVTAMMTTSRPAGEGKRHQDDVTELKARRRRLAHCD
jgi:hypothetical protein